MLYPFLLFVKPMTSKSSSTFHPGRSERATEGTVQEEAVESNGSSKHTPWPSQAKSVYTVDDAIEWMGFGLFQWAATLLCGIIFMADSIERMILSTLPFLCKCQWDLSSAEQAALTSALFFGALVGSTLWGLFADNFGRQKAIFGMGFVLLGFGALSAVKLTPDDRKYPGYPWLLVCRFGVGLGTSCIPQLSTYYIEFLPRKARAICTIVVIGLGSIGTVIAAGLAAAIMGESDLGWHWYLGISAGPLALGIILVPFFPESARYYLVKGKQEEAMKVLARVAWVNRKSLPEGRVVLYEEKYGSTVASSYTSKAVFRKSPTAATTGSINSPRQSFEKDESVPLLAAAIKDTSNSSRLARCCDKLSLLFVNGKWQSTLILVVVWYMFAWLYYGNVLLASTMVQYNPHCDVNKTSFHPNTSNSSCSDNDLDTTDFLEIMATAAAELPGIITNIIIIELIGRKLTLSFNFTMIAIGCGLLFLCPPEAALTVLLFFVRTFSMAALQATYVYTAEVYPTVVRGLGMGILNSISRLGAILTPFIAQVLFETSDYATLGVYTGSGAVVAVLSLLLPLETKGKQLKDKH